jgi:hypothetical protein
MTDPADIREYLAERAAIREFDGEQTRKDAERGAIAEARAKFGDTAVREALRQ